MKNILEGGRRIISFNKSRFPIKEEIHQSKSNETYPLVSIITAVRNGDEFIEDAIRSVQSQTYKNIEYIIVDGGSDDNTLEIIKKYEDFVDYWISEKDKGIADAWNKGLKLAKGEIIGFLNSDDMYENTSVEKAASVLNTDFPEISFGDVTFLKNRVVQCKKIGHLSKAIIKGFGFTHTTCFKTRKTFEIVGLFNTNYSIAVDTEFLLRCLNHKVNFKKATNQTFMEVGGISDRSFFKGYLEFLSAGLENGIFKSTQVRLKKIELLIYFIPRKLIKRVSIKNVKHSSFHFWNGLYNILPTQFLKRRYLKLSGIKIGAKSYIHRNLQFYRPGNITIGKNTVINHSSLLDNRFPIKIGDSVSIAHCSKIYTCGHEINSPMFELKCRGVVIEDYACIFANVMIMPGVRIGKGSVVLPGSIVTKSTEDYSVVGGNPAKHLKYRSKHLVYKLDYGWWYAK